MIVQNRHYREADFVVGANALKAMTASLRGMGGGGLGAFDFSAITDCSMLTPFQQSQAPQCGGGGGAASGPGVYVAPTQLTVRDCQPYVNGVAMGIPDAACVAANDATEHQQFQLNNDANRAVFLKNCNDAWIENDSRYAALNLPRPPNTCESHTFGQVFSSSGVDSFASIVAATDLIPSVAASNTQVAAYQSAQQPISVAKQTAVLSSAGGGNSVTGSGPIDLSSITDKVKSIGSGEVSVMGFGIPVWAIAAGVAGLVLLGSKN